MWDAHVQTKKANLKSHTDKNQESSINVPHAQIA